MKFLNMREPANTWTHFIPFLAGFVGLVFLIHAAGGQMSKLITLTIFGVGIIILYGASSLYHWAKTTPEIQLILRRIDHSAIFVLIASSYTPIVYFGLSGAWRWSILSVIWSLAISGILMKIWFMHMPRWVSTSFYLGLGWIAVIPFYQFVQNLSTGAIILLLVGGLAYTAGGVIYGVKKLKFFHEVFHIFVALGTLTHYLMVYFFIAPMSS